MNRIFLLLCALSCSAIVTVGQVVKPAKQVLELKMPRTADDVKPGTRGAAVVWHPTLKKYYAAFAGNTEYPLALFDEKGKLLSDESLSTMIDTRGLWYNPTRKAIMGNAYGDNGWFKYNLDTKGIPTEYEILQDGMLQPDPQSVGAYDFTGKQVLFFYDGLLYRYDEKGNVKDSSTINLGRTSTKGEVWEDELYELLEDYNYTNLIYTGIKGQEIGLLNAVKLQVELYDIKTGFLTKVITLPKDAKAEMTFNFAYANSTFWLFDMEARTWKGYR